MMTSRAPPFQYEHWRRLLAVIALGVGENAGGSNHNIHPQVLSRAGWRDLFPQRHGPCKPVYHKVAANNFHRSR